MKKGETLFSPPRSRPTAARNRRECRTVGFGKLQERWDWGFLFQNGSVGQTPERTGLMRRIDDRIRTDKIPPAAIPHDKLKRVNPHKLDILNEQMACLDGADRVEIPQRAASVMELNTLS